MSKIPDVMGITMAQNQWDLSTPQGKAIWCMTEEDGLEVDPVDRNTVLERYALDVVFYATGGQTWTEKAHFLSNMSVYHWNEYDADDYDYNPSSRHVGTNCTDGSSEINGLFLDKF